MCASKKTKRNNELSPLASSYLAHFDELKAYLKRFFSSDHDIEDVLQELYIRTTKAEVSQDIKSPRAFLYKVTKNLALNYKSQAYRRLTETVAEFSELGILYQTPSLEEQYEFEKYFVEFCNAIRTLPPRCRKTFVMRQIYGLNNREIAAKLNISVSTVETHLVKGLTLCKNYLEPRGYSTDDLDISPKKKSRKTAQ